MIKNVRIVMLAAALVAGIVTASAQLLYRVGGNGLANESYIFGTHHLAPVAVLDSVPGFAEAWSAAGTLIGEIDMTVDAAELGAAMTPYMTAPQDSTLSRLVDAETYQSLNQSLKQLMPGIPVDLSMFEGMRPMVLANIVAVNVVGPLIPGYNPQEQLDTHLEVTAKTAGKTIKALETPEMQARLLFATLPLDEQVEALKEVLDNPEELAEQGTHLTELYYKGDLDAMLEYGEETDDHPEFMKALLDSRNSDWLAKLPAMLSEGSSIVAVGALHLPGKNGILEGLRKAGYTVEAVK